MYTKRIRFANNVIVLYDYEKPQGNIFNDFYNQLIKKLDMINYNYAFLDFRKLHKKVIDKDINLFNLSDFALVSYLRLFEKDSKQTSLFDLKEEEQDKGVNLKVLEANFNAKKDRFIDLVNANMLGNCFFITLTYNEKNKKTLEDLTQSHKLFNKFIKSLNYYIFKTKKQKLKYVSIFELQKKNNRNALHYHMLAFDLPLKKLDLDRVRKAWGKGAVNVKRIYKLTSGVAKYMSKYMFKDMFDLLILLKGRKSYFSSKNLLRPFSAYVIGVEDDKIITNKGDIIDLKDYGIEQVEEYKTFFTGKTQKITFVRKNKKGVKND